MIGYIYSKSNRQIILKVNNVTTITDQDIKGDSNAVGINLSLCDYIVSNDIYNIGDTLNTNIQDLRSQIGS